MLKRYMHNRERYFAMLNANRIVREFEWGTEFVKKNANGDDPRQVFREYSKRMLANSDEFFHLPEITDYELSDKQLTWTSAIETTSPENNTAYAQFFPFDKDKNPPSSFCRIGTPKRAAILICAKFSTASAYRLCV